jgi:AcrR family transcriptional regulator
MTASDRKTIILNAVIKLLAEKGLDGVTHRAVDAAAELPLGTTSYHFSRKTLLLVAAADHLAVLLGKDCDELQVGFADHVARQGMDSAIAYVGDELVSYVDSARHLFLARMELTLASARRQDLAGIGDCLTAAARRPIIFFLTLISVGHTDRPIDSCAGLIDAITLMYVTGQGPKPTTDQIKAVFQSII